MSKNQSESICLNCGFCCNGVIFADLQLNDGEDLQHLLSLGLRLGSRTRRGSGSLLKLQQPCAAFCEGRCRIYSERPDSCRKFDCALLRRLEAGEVSREQAMRKIGQVQRQVDEVFRLLRELGDTDEQKPLAARLRQTTKRVDGICLDKEAASTYGQLTIAMQKLHCALSDSFYPG